VKCAIYLGVQEDLMRVDLGYSAESIDKKMPRKNAGQMLPGTCEGE
jgi:hypothetical protein